MRGLAGHAHKTKILLLGLDGLRWSIAAEDGLAPHLAAMASDGAFAEMTMPMPTMSGPGWSTLLTGTRGEDHGVVDNSFVGHRLHGNPDLLSRAFYRDQSTTTFAAGGWPPLVAPGGAGPVVHERAEQQRAGLHRVVARDGETFGYRTVDGEICDFALYQLRGESAPDVSFVYFCTIDDAGHVYGLQGEEYREAIALTDERVGRITAAVRARAAEHDERWLVAVVTDHGHRDEGGHGGDSDAERASFLLLWSPDGTDALPAIPAGIEPHQVSDILLQSRETGTPA
ncbi:alkaline phosphatase family protein [Brachybacterium sp. UNK5269]|uniref:alkaline phosphatase family protein n=1 Tax=Brachybacterium sp. UNK5269 TaxID=3408576 RepID=UPI003BAEFB6A